MSFTRPRQQDAGARGDGAAGDGSNGRGRDGLSERTGIMTGGTDVRDGRDGRIDRRQLKRGAKEAPLSVIGWLDERAGMSPTVRAMLYRKVPKGTNWFYTLGSATMFAFVAQAVTGVFLAMFYDPSPVRAYESIAHISNEVFAGELVRGMHRWGASVMVILIFLHMGRTFFFGAYKYPRELNWVIGVVLLVLTLAMSFTGYLLPFDQRSYWATVVGVNINASGPVIGPYLADFLRAGPDFTGTTLTRFYSIHMLLIPGLLAALIGAHLYLVTRQGTTAPPWLSVEKKRELSREEI
jgi:quinol-cytochrome oxidoreductase complex cytochrome b subunit